MYNPQASKPKGAKGDSGTLSTVLFRFSREWSSLRIGIFSHLTIDIPSLSEYLRRGLAVKIIYQAFRAEYIVFFRSFSQPDQGTVSSRVNSSLSFISA